jgi:CshA-type fibril repeat protein
MVGQPVSLRPLANDSPSSGAMLDPSTVRLRDPRTGRYQEQVTIPGTGTFRVHPDGTITFTPQQGFTGTTPSITYRVADSLGRVATSTVTVVVRDTPPPWADPQFGQAMRGQTVVFDPAAANAPGGSPFVPSSVRITDPATGKWTTTVKVPGEGTWTVDPATGRVRFTPLRSFVGAATPIAYRIANARGQQVTSTLHPLIRQKPPALSITTRASHATLRPGQRSLITLRIANHGLATTTRTVTRAPIPRGFAVANPMGGTVRGGWIWFTTGNLKAGGGTTRRFVLVATAAGVGQGNQQLTGWATSSNTRSATDPTALKVIGAVARKAPVTG